MNKPLYDLIGWKPAMCCVVVDSLFEYFDVLVMYTTIIWLPAVHKFYLNVILLVFEIHMSHFAYACKMRYPLNLVLEKSEYLWFY